MASVAICPHCYLQLVVPDGVEPDEQVECPTCAKAFGLDEAVLRAIPEVIRRSHSTGQPADSSLSESAAAAPADEMIIEEAVEVESLSADLDTMREMEQDEAEVVEQIKARIEAELASGNLLPGSSGSLSLETPSSLDDLDSPAELENESLEIESIDEWHRPTVRLNELTRLDDEFAEDQPEEDLDESVRKESFDEFSARAAAQSPTVIDDADVVAEVGAEAEAESADEEDQQIEPPVARPSATTLADLMPPADENSDSDESAEQLGPSFDLPNVPLTPTSATVEFDPNETFGPAAESEFSLDQMDFDAAPIEQSEEYEPAEYETSGDESNDYEPAAETDGELSDDDEPVFREPLANPLPSTPFVLPGLPHRRKKRSAFRLLVGTALGGLMGITLGYGVLLYVLGPEGDIFQVAQYLPETALPPSFRADTAPIVAQSAVDRTLPPAEMTPPVNSPVAESETDDSGTLRATYTEELNQPESSSLPSVLAEDERYDSEPSPLDEPPAEPISAAASADVPAPLPLRGDTYTVNDLATALENSEAALKGLVAGDLSDAAVRRTKGMSYAKLCDLAEAFTFVDRSAPSVESEQAIGSTVRLFRAALSDSHTRGEVNRIATIWIDSPHRQHGGVFLAGAVSGGEIAGDVYEYTLATEEGGEMTLLAAEPLDSSPTGSQHPVGIVGSIVTNPTGDVTGYEGTANRAIWVTRAIPLE